MDDFDLGDYVLMEVALAQFFKDLDISMQAGQQVQKLVGKIEVKIVKINSVPGAPVDPVASLADPGGLKA